MRRRAVLQGLVVLLPAAAGAASLLASSRQAFALGGTLPALNQSAPDFDLAGIAPAADGEAVPTRLNLADLRARQYLARQMENHFFGDGADAAQGYVPPSA